MPRSPQNPPTGAAPTGEPLILSKENRLSHAAVTRLAQGAAGDPVWLVYLYGPSGSGKSHLVRHFLRDARRHLPRLRVQSETTSEFVAKLGAASTSDGQAEFEAEYSAIDVLVLEDLAAIRGRMAAQRLLIVILDELKRSGGRVVITCSSLPGQLKEVLPKLVNRLRGGVCVPIELLDEGSRLNFARHLAATRQISVSSPILEMIAREGPSTPREILAALINMDLQSRRNGRDIDPALVRAQLKASHEQEERSLPQIAKVVARFYKIPLSELRSTRRQKRSALPRQIAMFLARTLSREPAAVIARFFGRKNHTTVIHACRRTRALLVADPALSRDVERLRRGLKKG